MMSNETSSERPSGPVRVAEHVGAERRYLAARDALNAALARHPRFKAARFAVGHARADIVARAALELDRVRRHLIETDPTIRQLALEAKAAATDAKLEGNEP